MAKIDTVKKDLLFRPLVWQANCCEHFVYQTLANTDKQAEKLVDIGAFMVLLVPSLDPKKNPRGILFWVFVILYTFS